MDLSTSPTDGRAYFYVHKVDEFIIRGPQSRRAYYQKVDESKKRTGHPLSGRVHKVDGFKPIEHRLSHVWTKERRRTYNNEMY